MLIRQHTDGDGGGVRGDDDDNGEGDSKSMEMAGAVVTVMVVLTTATVMTMVTVIVEEAMEALTVSMARVEEVMIVSSGSGDVGGGNACKGDSVNVDEDNMREVSGDGGLEVLTAATVDEGGNGDGSIADDGRRREMRATATRRWR